MARRHATCNHLQRLCPQEHTCGGVHTHVPSPAAVSFVILTEAENGTAGRVELTVEIGHEFTGQGTMDVSKLPPQHGLSAHAYRTPVMIQDAVQLTQYWPGLIWSGGGQLSLHPTGTATGTVAVTDAHEATRLLLTHAGLLPLAWQLWLMGSLWVSPALKEMAAGIHRVPLSWTSSGDTVRPVEKWKWLATYCVGLPPLLLGPTGLLERPS